MAASGSQKLPRKRILRGRSTLRRIRERGQKRHSRLVTLHISSREPGQSGETAFMVSVKTGSASARNQVKRRMREIYRRYIGLGEPGQVRVWVAKPAAASATFEELKASMLELARGPR